MYFNNKLIKKKEQQYFQCTCQGLLLFCFVLLYRYILSSERCWWGYNGLKPFQWQIESNWYFSLTETDLAPPISLTLFFTWSSPSYLSDLISYHSPFIYYSWTFIIAPQILWPPGPLHQLFLLSQNLHMAGAFSLVGSQSKCDLSREASSDYPISDHDPTLTHHCPSYYPDSFYL